MLHSARRSACDRQAVSVATVKNTRKTGEKHTKILSIRQTTVWDGATPLIKTNTKIDGNKWWRFSKVIIPFVVHRRARSQSLFWAYLLATIRQETHVRERHRVCFRDDEPNRGDFNTFFFVGKRKLLKILRTKVVEFGMWSAGCDCSNGKDKDRNQWNC